MKYVSLFHFIFFKRLSSIPLAAIFDGRGGGEFDPFDFSDAHFEELESRPMYLKNGRIADVLSNSIVAIAYSLGTYLGAKGRSLSPNYIFSILLATPEASSSV